MDKYKIEIIDNQISNCYELKVYKLSNINKWYQWYLEDRFNWVWTHGYSLGKKYMCPEIYKKVKTIEELFDIEVKRELERDGIEEVHRIVITKK
jgi:hypothetical protein